jgi:hypothetical protein
MIRVSLIDVWRVDLGDRRGLGAVIRIRPEEGGPSTDMHVSRLRGETRWWIDGVFPQGGGRALVKNGYGERDTNRCKVIPLRLDIGRAIDVKTIERGLILEQRPT